MKNLDVHKVRRRVATGSAVTIGLALLAGCGTAAGDAAESDTVTAKRDAGHVHTVAINPADGLTYLGTHGGLLQIDGDQATWVGPQIDLMGLVAVGPDHFYASGHPGEGAGLPDPVGLIESRDGGETWTPLSRQGKSDFHTLAASETGVVGFDGALRSSADGHAWQDVTIPREPYALTSSTSGDVLLATTPEGPLRSPDAGATWQEIESAPLLQFVDWVSGDDVVGVDPEGAVWTSADAGLTWEAGSALPTGAVAMSAAPVHGGPAEIVAVSEGRLWRSTDGGGLFVSAPIPTPEA